MNTVKFERVNKHVKVTAFRLTSTLYTEGQKELMVHLSNDIALTAKGISA